MINNIWFRKFPDNKKTWQDFLTVLKNPLKNPTFIRFAQNIYSTAYYWEPDPFSKQVNEELEIANLRTEEIQPENPDEFYITDSFSKDTAYMLAVMAAYAMVKNNVESTIIIAASNDDTQLEEEIIVEVKDNVVRITCGNDTVLLLVDSKEEVKAK